MKILIANRGEIALRIMRTCREMGIKTVAVYSEADRKSTVVRYADEAVCIGHPPSSESYLRGDRIIEVCKKLKVDAIHSGYGFLSENADFAKKVRAKDIAFIGPSSSAMQTMGDKLAAKAAVRKFHIPMIPGTDTAITNIAQAKKTALKIGYPILVKAAAGGGGKGMRIVQSPDDFEEQMKRAISEAKSAFGNGAVFIEKFVTSPRHIEIQILADKHGNIVYLMERECSIQRRHQKVIEEAPSVIVSPQMRKKMGECAVKVARACNYVGAGTVEFLVDDKLKFYFLEMNTRLQVEHPVTEFITGLDIVQQQILIEMGNKLAFAQKDIKINGHSIEARVYAEDSSNDFLPETGTLHTYTLPQGNGVRVDDGYEKGMEIPIYYDPMIAKLIVHGSNRKDAIAKMKRAISEYQITGVATTLPFCNYVMNHSAFTGGNFDTNFVKEHFDASKLFDYKSDQKLIAGAVAAYLVDNNKGNHLETSFKNDSKNNWSKNRGAL